GLDLSWPAHPHRQGMTCKRPCADDKVSRAILVKDLIESKHVFRRLQGPHAIVEPRSFRARHPEVTFRSATELWRGRIDTIVSASNEVCRAPVDIYEEDSRIHGLDGGPWILLQEAHVDIRRRARASHVPYGNGGVIAIVVWPKVTGGRRIPAVAQEIPFPGCSVVAPYVNMPSAGRGVSLGPGNERDILVDGNTRCLGLTIDRVLREIVAQLGPCVVGRSVDKDTEVTTTPLAMEQHQYWRFHTAPFHCCQVVSCRDGELLPSTGPTGGDGSPVAGSPPQDVAGRRPLFAAIPLPGLDEIVACSRPCCFGVGNKHAVAASDRKTMRAVMIEVRGHPWRIGVQSRVR